MGELNERGEVIVEMVGGFIPVTAEGKARARKKLADARARRTPERLNEMRAKVGMPAVPATNG